MWFVIHHYQRAAGEIREVHNHIGALRGCHNQVFHRHGNIPHTALGSDLPQVRTADVEVQDTRVAAVQDSEPVHARFDVEKWPDFAIGKHDVPEILTDPRHSFDIARRVEERPIRVELAILDNEWNLVRSARDADWIWLQAGVKLVA